MIHCFLCCLAWYSDCVKENWLPPCIPAKLAWCQVALSAYVHTGNCCCVLVVDTVQQDNGVAGVSLLVLTIQILQWLSLLACQLLKIVCSYCLHCLFLLSLSYQLASFSFSVLIGHRREADSQLGAFFLAFPVCNQKFLGSKKSALLLA